MNANPVVCERRERRNPFLEVLEVRPTKRWREVGDRDTDTAQFSRLVTEE
jgi:hypothetical protein